jgi:hypothetical protein
MLKLELFAAALSLLAAACGDSMTESSPDATTTPTPTSFTVRIENVAPWTVLKSGTQIVKTSGVPGAAASGDAYEITFTAGKKQNLSFASMFGESNDWFFAPDPAGIALYDGNGDPVSGDVTDQVKLWNAGTEVDQEPAVGPDTGPQQSAPDAGAADPDDTVRELPIDVTLSDGSTFTRPAVAEMLQATLTPGKNGTFTLRIENVSTDQTLVTSQGNRGIHLSPPVWALHIGPAPLFDSGTADRGQGLEQVAESGNGTWLGASLHALSGAATPVSPGVFVVGHGGDALFSLGQADRGQGLERLAEEGNSAPLLASIGSVSMAQGFTMTGGFDTPVGASSAGPARPGDAYELTLSAMPGDRLSFATMFGMSDDWFFAAPPEGIALFDAWDQPISGDVSDQIGIFDAGTEINEELAIGPDTAPQQPAADTGPADPIDQVRAVPASEYPTPASAHLRVTITPQ